MKYHIHRSIPVTGDIEISQRLRGCDNAPFDEWPLMKGFEDKQALSALNV